jgi:RNA polymerase sigma-B factor
MTASVVVNEGHTTQPGEQPTVGGCITGRAHGGRHDCCCGRADCREEFMALAAVSDPRTRSATRDRLIESHLDLAYRIARHYRRPGPGFEDIRQVAALALVEAVSRFDPSLGSAFSAFAVPTITGGIKRHFRDQRWTVHPPRRVKELRLRLRAATDLLTQQMRRTPTVADLAEHLACGQEEICEALCTDDALRPLSIDSPIRAADDDMTLGATLGCPDAGYARVENLATLRPLLAELPERELQVITMRFVGNLTQSQIAERVGCSQMHISRILRAALERLRHALQDDPAGRCDNAAADPDIVPNRRDAAQRAGKATEALLVTHSNPRRPAREAAPAPELPSGPEWTARAADGPAHPSRRACVPTGPPQRHAVTGGIRRPRKTGSRARLTTASAHLVARGSAPARGRPPNREARVGTVGGPVCRVGRWRRSIPGTDAGINHHVVHQRQLLIHAGIPPPSPWNPPPRASPPTGSAPYVSAPYRPSRIALRPEPDLSPGRALGPAGNPRRSQRESRAPGPDETRGFGHGPAGNRAAS